MFSIRKQGVLFMAMVGYKIRYNNHPTSMYAIYKLSHIIPCAKMWIYLLVICYMIAMIGVCLIEWS